MRPWSEDELARLREILPHCAIWRETNGAIPGRSGEGCRCKARELGWTELLGSAAERPHRARLRPGDTSPATAPLLDIPSLDPEDWLDLLEEAQRLAERADPVYTSQPVEIDTELPIAFMAASCLHLGSRYALYGAFRDLLRRTLETPRVYWGLHGDLSDNFLTHFRDASAVLDQLCHPKFQRRLVAMILGQLAKEGRILYGCAGNHEDFLVRAIGEDLIAPEFQTRKIPYFVGKGVVRLRVGAEEYVLGVAHSWPGTSAYNPTHPELRALLKELPGADFVIGGHTHEFGIQEIYHHTLAHDAGLFRSPIAHLVQTGTLKAMPDPYAVKGWSRGIFEWPLFILYPDRHMVKRAYDWEDLSHFLRLEGI